MKEVRKFSKLPGYDFQNDKWSLFFSNTSTNVQAYVEPNQASKMESIKKIVNDIL